MFFLYLAVIVFTALSVSTHLANLMMNKVIFLLFVKNTDNVNLQQINNDSLCVRSYINYDNNLLKVAYNTGEISFLPLSVFNKMKKCHL